MSPNATALESIKCTLGGTTLTDPYNLRAWPTDSKAGRYFVCYNTAVTLQSTPNARSAEGKASPPSAPAVAGTYRRIGARQPHFYWFSRLTYRKNWNFQKIKNEPRRLFPPVRASHRGSAWGRSLTLGASRLRGTLKRYSSIVTRKVSSSFNIWGPGL